MKAILTYERTGRTETLVGVENVESVKDAKGFIEAIVITGFSFVRRVSKDEMVKIELVF